MGPEHLQISLSKVGPVTNPLQMLRDDYASVHRDSQGMEQEFYSMKLQGFLLLCLSQLM